MKSMHETLEDRALQDEEKLLAYLQDTIIPCASCGEDIEIDTAHRWINRLVCSGCIAEYEGLTEDDEFNYDETAEEEETEE